MTILLAGPVAPDMVVTFQIRPGMFRQFLDARQEGGPRLKCYEGSVTLCARGIINESALIPRNLRKSRWYGDLA